MLTRRGVKLVWTQEGALGRQSFAAFMITIAVGFVLLHLMVVVGNFVATRLLPGRHLYRRAVEEEVPGIDACRYMGGGARNRSPCIAPDMDLDTYIYIYI